MTTNTTIGGDGIGVALYTVASAASSTSHRPRRRQRMGPGHGQAASVAGYSSYCTDNEFCRCFDCAS
jgi:hypothetical protein